MTRTAVDAYFDPIIHKLTRTRIERRTAIALPKNKRNGRSQAKHLEGARAIRDINNDNWREGNGRKPKADLVRDYALAHPDANHSEIARALGISRPTVIKWLKTERVPTLDEFDSVECNDENGRPSVELIDKGLRELGMDPNMKISDYFQRLRVQAENGKNENGKR